ncbi:phenylalanine--tRNA ligase subunit beta [Acinetobacter sp. c2-A9]|uniref:phenylalanine--tRNA ligase subunit beta n=1 Tax=Acinetobacter sp. c2-A9 TaxID=3342802 RepID=UPI0035B7AB93
MKLSEQWLRSWVNPSVDSETLAEQLTMLGLEIDDNSPVVELFTGVVVGEVLTVEQHPDADRLRVTTVNIGDGNPLQIVCGAPNVRVGMKAPVAVVGAVLPKDFKIKKGKLRGVESQGMLCGASEIGLEDKIDGLLELADDAPVGVNIRDYLNLDDRVLDISITPNRGDCFSLRGIAREIAVINKMTYQASEIVDVPADFQSDLTVNLVSDTAPRYLGRVVKNVNTKAVTPEWMERALSRSGIRSHSILVDITNYVMMEFGQPMHAFDFAGVQGGIQVRLAKAGETLQLLNEQNVELHDDITVIADDVKVLAIGGIMGGLSSSVTDSTTDILLESAFFEPIAIAGRARRFGLHTDVSQRFERGVDFNLPMLAMQRASQLIKQYAGGEFSQIISAEKADALPKRHAIELSQAQVDKLLGFPISADFIVDTLQRLECQVESHGDSSWTVTPPSHRYDLNIYQDLIEEIARIYGYDNIPVGHASMPIKLEDYQDQTEIGQLRQTLVSLGYQEAISFSFVDKKLEQQLNPNGHTLALANPISSELAVMRSTLVSSLIPCVQYNLNRQQHRVRFFELGLRFAVGAEQNIDSLQQIPTLAMIAVGSHLPEQWHGKAKGMDFYDLKAEVEQLLSLAKYDVKTEIEYVRSERAWLHPGQSAEILVQGKSIGYLGRLHPSLEESLDLGQTWLAELDKDQLLRSFSHKFTELSRFPSVKRDISIVISDKIDNNQIIQTIRQTADGLLDDVWLFDVYTGQGVEDGHRSLAFALQFQHASRTLEDAEIKQTMDNVIQTLESKYNAKLRAS